MEKNTAVLRTPYRNVLAALDTFCSIRKEEGAAPATIQLYRPFLLPFLRDNPSFLDDPRECTLSFVSEPDNDWSKFTLIKVMKVFCCFIQEEEILEKDPLKGIKAPIPSKRMDIPSLEDVKEFIGSLNMKSYTDRRMKVMFLLALDTGLRRGELCGLRIDDLDPEGMLITVRPDTSKAKRPRIVPVSPQVVREI